MFTLWFIRQSRLHSHSGTFIHLRWTNRGKILLANPSIAAVAVRSLHTKHKETPKAVSEACHHYYPADTRLVPQHFTQLTRTTNFKQSTDIKHNSIKRCAAIQLSANQLGSEARPFWPSFLPQLSDNFHAFWPSEDCFFGMQVKKQKMQQTDSWW